LIPSYPELTAIAVFRVARWGAPYVGPALVGIGQAAAPFRAALARFVQRLSLRAAPVAVTFSASQSPAHWFRHIAEQAPELSQEAVEQAITEDVLSTQLGQTGYLENTIRVGERFIQYGGRLINSGRVNIGKAFVNDSPEIIPRR
jgi:septum formation inhibitor MinC